MENLIDFFLLVLKYCNDKLVSRFDITLMCSVTNISHQQHDKNNNFTQFLTLLGDVNPSFRVVVLSKVRYTKTDIL